MRCENSAQKLTIVGMLAWARAGVGAGVGAEAVRSPQAETVAGKSVHVLPYRLLRDPLNQLRSK